MKRRALTVFCVVLFAILVMTASDAKAADETSIWNETETEIQTEESFTYYIHPSQNKEEAWLYKIEIKEKKCKSLTIPETILGKKVTRLGCPEFGSEEDELDEAYATLFGTYIEPWHNQDGSGTNTAVSTLKSIQLPDTVEYIDRAAFSGLDSITTITLPNQVKEIGMFTFYGCDNLKTIVLPEQMDSFQNSSLWGCPKLKNIKLSKKNAAFQVKGKCLIRKKDKALIFAAAVSKKFTIPGGTKKITSYAFSSATSSVIHIPASVSKIEKKAFNMFELRENPNIKDVTISKKNPVFARDGQCIYRKSNKSLAVAIPDNKGNLRISERVKKLTPDISLVNCDTANTSLEKVVYPSGLKHLIVPSLTEINARNVYFKGSVPPKIANPNNEEYGELPIFCHIYVPKKSINAYKTWYKKHGYPLRNVNGWHTFNP